MLNPNMTTLYVNDAEASGKFYARLLGRPPVDASPAFVLFAADGGLMLGLWKRDTVQPAAENGAGGAGGTEVTFAVGEEAEVDATCADWKKHGIPIAQEPVNMPFGRTFVGVDPDGHRLRVYAQTNARS
jgi:catechol 2,3-dioxygenase-like lactoylglutathione lyase family enzyme